MYCLSLRRYGKRDYARKELKRKKKKTKKKRKRKREKETIICTRKEKIIKGKRIPLQMRIESKNRLCRKESVKMERKKFEVFILLQTTSNIL